MVTGRDAFPSVSVGIGGSQKVELRSPRPALMYVYRAAAALPFTAQAQESVRRVAVLMSTTPDEPESQALQSGTSLNSFSLVRVVMGNPPAGRFSLDKIVNPPEGDNVVA